MTSRRQSALLEGVQFPDDLVPVEYAGETCDAVEGFLPVTVYAVFYPKCASAYKEPIT